MSSSVIKLKKGCYTEKQLRDAMKTAYNWGITETVLPINSKLLDSYISSVNKSNKYKSRHES